MRRNDIRNIVIIAHVDHGKTSLVDCLLHQSGQFRESQLQGDCILDSNDQERERGITILAKNISLPYKGVKINIIDTPGHADFGGEVERVVRMADGAVVLMDAAEGPMPQTRFVLSKALEVGLKPIVLINKIDRPDARPHETLDEAFALLMDLGAEEHLEDFKYLFASGRLGYATTDPEVKTESMQPLLDMVLEQIPGPDVDIEAPLQMLCTTLDWSEFVGRIAVGRVQAGSVKRGQTVALVKKGGVVTESKVQKLYIFTNLGRTETEEVQAGDVCAIVGVEDVEIGDTICHREHVRPLPRLTIDEPTLEMIFTINSSPFAGKEGKYVTNRQLRERLTKELERNVALRVRQVEGSDAFAVSGRGVLHLSVLIEAMRREGYELSVGKPQVIMKEIDGVKQEPFESLVVEVPSDKLGPVMELVGARRGETEELHVRGDFTHCKFMIPARGLIGLRTRLLNGTQGTAVVHHRFAGYKPVIGEVPKRPNGVYVSMVTGKANAFGLNTLQERADMFVTHNDEVYEGQIVGENARDNDLAVNPTKEKKLTNMRASGTDDNILLKPPRRMDLEAALEYIEDDELVEITPTQIRLRKMLLKEHDRRREGRKEASTA
ncbi:translational GTPase TypA [Anatilimnocola floriformis]|uniref:translational GTPase TypA n=1 Tax=Anatilimnocola floriformis TaxID=2948575 RepID=UPI0020C45D27|nr:translational GTPase TypA [Anatilimnocola floriformis]